ncbi:MAG: YraN family protein [Pseudomonadota bacterium]
MNASGGFAAERFAGWFLRLKGYRILDRRYATPLGEIDLVVANADTVVFVEVKKRATPDLAAAALTRRQRERIKRAAALYLQCHPQLQRSVCRFDLVGLSPWRWPHHTVAAWE